MESCSAVVPTAAFKRRSIKSSDSLSRRRAKGNMEAIARHDDTLGTKPDGKFIIATGQSVADRGFLVAGTGFVSPNADITERREGGIVKRGRAFEVRHTEREMVQHVHRLK
jgi:hypothetical protein